MSERIKPIAHQFDIPSSAIPGVVNEWKRINSQTDSQKEQYVINGLEELELQDPSLLGFYADVVRSFDPGVERGEINDRVIIYSLAFFFTLGELRKTVLGRARIIDNLDEFVKNKFANVDDVGELLISSHQVLSPNLDETMRKIASGMNEDNGYAFANGFFSAWNSNFLSHLSNGKKFI